MKKTKKRNPKRFKKLNCSPKSEKNEIKDYSCYTSRSILKLRDLWNIRHSDAKILSSNPKEIHTTLSEHLKDVCNTEACWLKQKAVFGEADEDMKGAFAPKSPDKWKSNPNEWLSSLDITRVMKQYEKTYPCFVFIGPSPIDFDTREIHGECVWKELCDLSIAKEIRNGKYKIGIIFNTDEHDKPGEHWISMFIKINKKKSHGCIFFFDSVGETAPKEIKVLANRIIEEGKQMVPPIHIEYDENHPVEHQYGNTECGIYSIFFIVEMLKDKITGNYLKTHILKDKYIEKFRKIFFNEEL